VLIAYADSGGGHRAAAIAIRDALRLQEDTLRVDLHDPWVESARWPFRRLRHAYPFVIQRAPWLWGAGFRATNSLALVRTLQRATWPVMRRGFEVIAAAGAPACIVCTHPLLATPLRRVFPRVPIVVVVTDLVTGHVSWYDQASDTTVVPTEAAAAAAIRAGMTADRVRVLGLPVAPAFTAITGERRAMQVAVGWATDRPTVLLAGGGDGVGSLASLADAIDEAALPCDLAVVAGRNASLAASLRVRRWRGTVHVYDFVANFPQLLLAAAVLVTKAGPGTIAEACASGCPMILTSAIAGQEVGNIAFVRAGEAGVWAPSPRETVEALRRWLVGPEAATALAHAASRARALARPAAAADIASLVRQVVASPG
jgi:1,2-diacylglycerol 3-beta-galactosyltransferase